MKLYYSPSACSLADRIALHEAGLSSDFERVGLKTKKTETGADFRSINAKGYVPVLVLDDGEVVTENIAVLSWIADLAPSLAAPGAIGRIRLLEVLAFISTEIHKAAKPFFNRSALPEDKANARKEIGGRFELLAKTFVGPYLFGTRFSAADAYLFVTLRWAILFGIPIPNPIDEYLERVKERDSVRRALAEEELDHTLAPRPPYPDAHGPSRGAHLRSSLAARPAYDAPPDASVFGKSRMVP